MSADGITALTVAELGERLRTRALSPAEVLHAYLDRIDRLESRVRAFTTLCREPALGQARDAERQIAAGNWKGPLHGVPVTVKDQFDVQGVRTTCASRLMNGYVAPADATVMERLRDAGAVILGKTSLNEFAMGGNEEPYVHPRNPWNLAHSPGVSSQGSAAGIAAGFSPASIGEDTGGSVRMPASCCGISGLRPTQGRVSRHGGFEWCWLMDTPGPMSWTAEDCAILLRAIAGHDPRDPTSARVEVPDYAALIPRPVGGLRACVLENLIDHPSVSLEVRRAVRDAIAAVAGLGIHVEGRSLPVLELAPPVFVALCDSEGAGVHQQWLRTRAREYTRLARIRLLAGSLLPAALVAKARRARIAIRQALLDLLEEYDVLLCPTNTGPAPKISEWFATLVKSKEEAAERLLPFRHSLTPFSLAGVPALSVPCGFTAAGLPLGLQIAGRPFAEATVLQVGHAYQQVTGWHRCRPPL